MASRSRQVELARPPADDLAHAGGLEGPHDGRTDQPVVPGDVDLDVRPRRIPAACWQLWHSRHRAQAAHECAPDGRMAAMRVVSIEQLKRILASLPDNPRVVASGNFATPHVLLGALDAVVPEYRLHMLNAQKGLPDREGVTYETAFVGPGMRQQRAPRLHPLPAEPRPGPLPRPLPARRRAPAHVDRGGTTPSASAPRSTSSPRRSSRCASAAASSSCSRTRRCPTPTATRRSTSTRSTTSSRSTSRCPRTPRGRSTTCPGRSAS